MADVGLQLDRVLASNSSARQTSPHQVEALERALKSEGRESLIERVAYTWFNRFIALRYMDARGYTSVGVVSPALGTSDDATILEPEILTFAKQGNIDASVVGEKAADEVRDLLFGSTHHPTSHEEAYRLLLLEYSRHWNQSMPFMFEPPEDFTELLTPPSLLAGDSVRAKAVEALTPEICEQGVEAIGWLYQFYNADLKDEVYASFKKNVKAGSKEIPAATQLFTPNWIVRYLVQNSLGRLWLENNPGSSLRDHMDYYVDDPTPEEIEEMDALYGTSDVEVVAVGEDEGEDSILKVSSPEEIKVLDPACGSGHMLTYAFDLLYLIYEEEGYAPSQIATLILENNLLGFEIDPRAAALASFALAMKAREKQRRYFNKKTADGLPTQPNIQVIEPIRFTEEELDWLRDPDIAPKKQDKFWEAFEHADVLGSLIQPDAELIEPLLARVKVLQEELEFQQAALDGVDHRETLERAQRVLKQSELLAAKYHVVVANPPYLGSRWMGKTLHRVVSKAYPDGKRDLFAVFVLRGLDLASKSGFAAMITMHEWMFLRTFEDMRKKLLKSTALLTTAHLGTRAFDRVSGEVVATAAFVVKKIASQSVATFLRLTAGKNEEAKQELMADALHSGRERYRLPQRLFQGIPGETIAYWSSPKVLRVLSRDAQVSMVTDPRQGIATANNALFLRLWWEVSGAAVEKKATDGRSAEGSGARWFPYNKGGYFRKWWGNQEHLIDWEDDGKRVWAYGTEDGGKRKSVVRNPSTYFLPSTSWSDVSSGAPAFRSYPKGFIYDAAGPSVFGSSKTIEALLSIGNSSVVEELLKTYAAGLHFGVGMISRLPLPNSLEVPNPSPMVDNARDDWNSFETSWDFTTPPVTGEASLRDAYQDHYQRSLATAAEQQRLEEENNRKVAELYGLEGEVPIEVPMDRVSLTLNPEFRYGSGKTDEEYEELFMRDAAMDLMSYAAGNIFGRFSLDKPGFVLMDQGSTVEDFYEQVPNPSFAATETGVVPATDGDWFEDGLTNQVRKFIRTAFGDEHYTENIAWIEEALGVKRLEDYFPKKFWADHLKRYKKRPIYWLFSSGWKKDSFHALIYLHRYTPDTVGEVLNLYVRELIDKQRSALDNAERIVKDEALPRAELTKARRVVRDLRSSLEELEKYDREILHPLAGERVELDLDDGVKVNYPKLYPAVRKVPGL